MIYLDNAATTQVSDRVLNSMLKYMKSDYGNPSSLYGLGVEAKHAINVAREKIKTLINASAKDHIVFTSGGSEANNLAIRGLVPHLKKAGKTTIVTSDIEHPSIYETCRDLKNIGFRIVQIPVDNNGKLHIDTLQRVLETDQSIGLVSVIAVNNEIGSVQDINLIGQMCMTHGVYYHVDAVQAVGHIVLDIQNDYIDMLSISGHKFHAQKGVGALFIKHDVPLTPITTGGHQESGFRAGTENVPSIVGMGIAAEDAQQLLSKDQPDYTAWKSEFLNRLASAGVEHFVNGSGIDSIISLTLVGCESEALLLLLDGMNVCVSSGSACSSGSLSPSHVLTAIGLDERLANCTIRISMGRYNSLDDMLTAADCIICAINQLKAML